MEQTLCLPYASPTWTGKAKPCVLCSEPPSYYRGWQTPANHGYCWDSQKEGASSWTLDSLAESRALTCCAAGTELCPALAAWPCQGMCPSPGGLILFFPSELASVLLLRGLILFRVQVVPGWLVAQAGAVWRGGLQRKKDWALWSSSSKLALPLAPSSVPVHQADSDKSQLCR